MPDPFVHLHVASGYSLRHGASHPQVLVERAAELEMDALALTDRDGVYGAVRFAKAALASGVRPVLGVDLATPLQVLVSSEPHPHPQPHPQTRFRTPVRGGASRDPRLSRVTFLAQGAAAGGGKTGWAALSRLVSAAHAAGERGAPVCSPALVAAHVAARPVRVLLGPGSELGRAVALRRDDLAAQVLRRWLDLVGPGQLAVEVVSHRLAGSGPGSSPHAGRMLGLALRHGITTVLTNAVRFADRLDAPVTDVLDATRRLVPLDPRHLDRRNAEGFAKSGKQMREVAEEICHYAGLGEGRETTALLARTRAVAEECVLDPRADLGLGEVHFPELEVETTAVPTRVGAEGPADAVLRARCEAAIGWRFGNAPRQRIWKRLDDELDTIRHLGYASYFLTVGEVTEMIKDLGIRTAARGSGAGSLVNYLLGISGIDPIRHGLLMERFLSPLRRSLPDIDIDVESARRLEVYDAILERFGRERCATVSMMETYRVRHAIRDVGAALGMPRGEIDTLAKSFPHIRARDARMAMRDLPELRPLLRLLDGEKNGDDKNGDKNGDQQGGLEQFFRLVESLDGLPRHVAMHPCGVLLSDRELLDRTPVEQSSLGYPMSQFDKDDVEDLGLLKLDVLGIRMQSSMAHAVAEIARVEGTVVDLDDETQVPLDDLTTYEMISSAKTLGVFQIESPGQRELVGKSGIESFADIIADISLFRPGPVKSDMITPYLEVKQGWRLPGYLHDDLRPILAGTRGVVVFHEQVIEIISTFTGCGYPEGDERRRALGDTAGMARTREWFTARALARGYDARLVVRLWQVVEAFASFGFCKAHAAAFALPTYQSAWLKAHYPAHFLAGILTHDPGMYPKRLLLDDARQLGITVLGVDVNASGATYAVERAPGSPGEYGIRIPLAEVRGIDESQVDRVVAAREGAPYASLTDFAERARVSRPVLEHLVQAGGFDALYGLGERDGAGRRHRVTRRDLLLEVADLDRLHRAGSQATRWRRARDLGPRERAEAKREGSVQLALELGEGEQRAHGSLPEMTASDRVRAELEILGLDASRHVMSFHREFLDELGTTWSAGLLAERSHRELLVAGVKVATQTPPIRSGRRVVFVTLDDGTGPVDATLFDDVQGPYAGTVFGSWLLVVRGVMRRTGRRGVSLRATGAWDLATLQDLWQAEGIAAVRAELERSPRPGQIPAAPGPHRVLVHSSGFQMSPYADLKPAGDSTGVVSGEVARKLWHRSPGSPG